MYLKILLLLLLLYYHFDCSVADVWFQAIDVNVSGNSKLFFVAIYTGLYKKSGHCESVLLLLTLPCAYRI